MKKSELKQIIREELKTIQQESKVSSIHIMAREAKDFNDFVKTVLKEFPLLGPSDTKRSKSQFFYWLKQVYADAKS